MVLYSSIFAETDAVVLWPWLSLLEFVIFVHISSMTEA